MYQYFYNCKQARATYWALILAPACLPPELYFFENKLPKSIFFKTLHIYLQVGHFVSQHTMG